MKRNFVILDIDSTILDPKPRVRSLLKDFLSKQEIVDSELGQDLVKLSNGSQFVGFEQLFLCPSITSKIYPEHRSVFKQAMLFWEQNYLKNKFLMQDKPIPGAQMLVKELNKHYHLLFLTARIHEKSINSTKKQLDYHFSIKEPHLKMKPREEISSSEFKAGVVNQIKDNIVAMIDDDLNILENINYLNKVKCLYLATMNTNLKTNSKNINTIKSYTEQNRTQLLNQIKP
jgi:hypothetical protein